MCVRGQVIYGRWLIDGYPKVVLFDIATAMRRVDDWKQEIWTTSRIGIPWVDQEATDAVAFGFMTAIFLAEVYRRPSRPPALCGWPSAGRVAYCMSGR